MSRAGAVVRRDGSRLEITDTFVPNAKQRQFWHHANRPFSEVEEVLYDGSIRGGKTQAGVRLLVAWAMAYGGTYVISRFSYRELEDSTKKVCLYGDGALPPAIPTELLRGGRLDLAKNETHNKVTLRNGAEILFRALEQKERGKVRNLTASGWFIDQAEELEPGTNETEEELEDFYMEIKGRCSDPRGPRKLLLVANPGPEDHLLYRRFIDPRTRHPKTARVHCTIHDNRANVPPDYYEMLLATEHTNPAYFNRMVMGMWGVTGGKRFKTFDRRIHVCEPFDIPSSWTILEGGDYGWANYTAWEWLAIDHIGRHYVVAEHAAKEWEVKDHAKAIKAIRRGLVEPITVGPLGLPYDAFARRPFQGELEPSAIWLDPASWHKREGDSIAMNFLQHEIYAAKAINDRLGGWNRIEEKLNNRLPDGGPELMIFSNCELLIKELPNLRIKPGTEDVEKVNDHASDALRYIIMSQQPGSEAPTPEEEHTREAVAARIAARAEERRLGRAKLIEL